MKPARAAVLCLEAPPRGRVLALAPHADDEVLGLGGTLLKHAAQGDAVEVVIAFDGLLGLAPRHPRDTRRREASRAAGLLGLAPYRFLDHPEGHEPAEADLEAGARQVAELIACFAPDLVYGPWPGESHVDHRTLARVLARAAPRAPGRFEVWGYEVWTPLVAERLVAVDDVWPRKLAALAAYASQSGDDELARRAEERALSRADLCPARPGRSEAFVRLHGGTGAPWGPP